MLVNLRDTQARVDSGTPARPTASPSAHEAPSAWRRGAPRSNTSRQIRSATTLPWGDKASLETTEENISQRAGPVEILPLRMDTTTAHHTKPTGTPHPHVRSSGGSTRASIMSSGWPRAWPSLEPFRSPVLPIPHHSPPPVARAPPRPLPRRSLPCYLPCTLHPRALPSPPLRVRCPHQEPSGTSSCRQSRSFLRSCHLSHARPPRAPLASTREWDLSDVPAPPPFASTPPAGVRTIPESSRRAR